MYYWRRPMYQYLLSCAPILSNNLCSGTPDSFNEFKNSVDNSRLLQIDDIAK